MSSKEEFHNFRKLQSQYLFDVDLSGGLFLEFEKLNNGNNKHDFKDRQEGCS